MNRFVLGTVGIFVIAYGSLMWLTAASREHAPKRSPQLSAALPVPQRAQFIPASAMRTTRNVPQEPSSQLTLGTLRDSRADAEMAPDPASEPSRPIWAEPVNVPTAHSSPRLAQDVRESPDENVRLTAIRALLALGRHSLLDADAIDSLRIASNDRNRAIASEANSALQELASPMH